MQLLLVEDDPETAGHVARVLRAQGHALEHVSDGAAGLECARERRHDVLIVDRMLPSLDGLSLVRQLRAEGNAMPALFLTTMSGLDDRVEGLEGGGDDYLVKPFAFAELVARVGALGRRARPEEPVRLACGDLEMDLIRRAVRRAGRDIELQAQEFRLLEYLLRHVGTVVTRAMLLEHVWDLHFEPRTNVVETHVSRLRGKVDRGFGHELIRTVRGVGYVLRAD
jgi:two-component system OmpR family response regulator